MNIVLSSIGIAVLFGTYDLFIKLGAGRLDPALGAMVTQVASALTLVGVFLFQYLKPGAPRPQATVQGILFVTIAGVLIATALIFLFFLLQNKAAKATTTLPTILILRNITLVVLGVIVLQEKISVLKIIGVGISLLGIYLISI